ncbi:MAG TPA: type IV pilus biogenesis/stability protein PilW [Gallionella sp.]
MNRLIVVVLSGMILAGCGTTSDRAKSTESARVHTELAGLYYERAQYGVALEETALALEADPNYSQAYGVRGLVHMALREDKQAEEDFRKGLRLDGNNAGMNNNFGWFLCQRGREKESIPHFMSALKDPLYRTPEVAYLNAGLCSRKAGHIQDAEEFLLKSLQNRPDMPQALIALAGLNFDKGEYGAAKQYLARFSDHNRNLTADQLWLAVRIHRKLRDRNSEASYGLQLRKRYPDAKETQMLMRGE